jgi:phosphoesterase RecJ-like protein
MYRTSKQIHNQIKKSEKILLIPHVNPDGDALGSLTAFVQFLHSIDKECSAFCASKIPDNLKLLPHIEKITDNHTILENSDFETNRKHA